MKLTKTHWIMIGTGVVVTTLVIVNRKKIAAKLREKGLMK